MRDPGTLSSVKHLNTYCWELKVWGNPLGLARLIAREYKEKSVLEGVQSYANHCHCILLHLCSWCSSFLLVGCCINIVKSSSSGILSTPSLRTQPYYNIISQLSQSLPLERSASIRIRNFIFKKKDGLWEIFISFSNL